jgi:hypothetical protein
MMFSFSDFATAVGFYAVSIPFLDAEHLLLAGCGKDERFRVSFNSFHRIFVIF